jgi:hypothetical protein
MEDQRNVLEGKRAGFEHDTDEVRRIGNAMLDSFGSPDAPPPIPPVVSDLSLQPERGSLITRVPVRKRDRIAAVLKSVSDSVWGPSRDGKYRCAIVPMVDGSKAVYLQWTRREVMTPALEIKSALERKLKSALSKPRRRGCAPPRPEQISGNEDVVRGVLANADEIPGQNELSDFLPRPTGEGREAIKKNGFEAIAWYQQFHCYDEGSWGIYLHSPKLDEFVADLASTFGEPKLEAARWPHLWGSSWSLPTNYFTLRSNSPRPGTNFPEGAGGIFAISTTHTLEAGSRRIGSKRRWPTGVPTSGSLRTSTGCTAMESCKIQ